MRQFGKKQAASVKGMAVLMMLWHHLYWNMDELREAGVDATFFPFSEYNMVNLAKVFKICVSLFAIVSGYGLYLDYSKSEKDEFGWIKGRLKKLLVDYWFIFILSFVVTMLIDQRPLKVYFINNVYDGCFNIFLDFLGVSSIFDSPTLLGTWWYMGAAVLYIVLTPFLVRHKKYLWLIFAATGAVVRLFRLDYLGGTNPYLFLCAFQIGMIAAHYDMIHFCIRLKRGFLPFLTGLAVLWAGYRLYTYLPYGKYWEVCWAFFPLAVVIFSVRYLVDLPVLGSVFWYLGKHSYFLFLTHTFIRIIYLKDFIYNRNCFVSFGLLLLTSVALSLLCEWLERILGYRENVDKLLRMMQKKYNRIAAGEDG